MELAGEKVRDRYRKLIILAVIVLYKVSLAQSSTVQTPFHPVRFIVVSRRIGIRLFTNIAGDQEPGALPEFDGPETLFPKAYNVILVSV